MNNIGRTVLVVVGLVLQYAYSAGQQVVDIDVLRPGLSPSELPFELPGLDLNFSGAGAVARGMGGAFTGVSGNICAIGFNPAGLSVLDRPQTSLVYRHGRPDIRNRQFATGGGVPGFDENFFEGLNQIDFGAVAAPGKIFGHSFVGVFAYGLLADQFFADRLSTASTVTVDDSLLQTTSLNLNRRVSGKLAGFNLGMATRFKWLAVGATFQLYQGGFSDTTLLEFGPYYVRPSNGQDTTHILPVVARSWLGNEVNYRGSSLLLGIQANYRKARLGIAARIPTFSLGQTDVFRLKSNMDIGSYDSVYISGLYQQNISQQNRLFLTNSSLELPLSFSTGLSYLFGRGLLVDFDYTYTNWGAADLKVRRIFQAPFSNMAALQLGSGPVGLTSTHQLRLGWETEFNPGFARLFLRGGVRTIPVRTLTSLNTPYFPFSYTVRDSRTGRESTFVVTDYNFLPTFKDSFVVDAQGNIVDTISTVTLQYRSGINEDRSARGKFWQQFGASLGFGIQWNQVALDVAYDYSTFWRNSYTSTSSQGVLTSSRRQRQHRLFVSFTGYFTRL